MKWTHILIGTLLALPAGSWARAAQKTSDAIWYERIETDCKAQAKRYYSAIRFKKRRAFVKHCVERVYR